MLMTFSMLYCNGLCLVSKALGPWTFSYFDVAHKIFYPKAEVK